MNLPEASRQRQALRAMIEEYGRLAHSLMQPRELLKGSVYQLRTRCGKDACRCARSRTERHTSTVLSWSEEGRTRLRSITPTDEVRLRRLTELYRRYRETRASLVRLHRRILAAVDRLEKALRSSPPAPRRGRSKRV